VAVEAIRRRDADAIGRAFHAEHGRMYGYSLEDERVPVELINVRVLAVGLTEKPEYAEEPHEGADATAALKDHRPVYIPQERATRPVPVYDGHRTHHGNQITGPALIEQANTTLFLTAGRDCICDKYGSFVAYRKGHDVPLAAAMQEQAT
jgi:N-methylhydantoinase A